MMQATYVGLSAQLALQRRLETIANNIANASTAGFRAEHVRFEVTPSGSAVPETAFAGTGRTYLARLSGELVRTDGPLDVAVDGDAWLGVNTPAGLAFSRDGRLTIAPTGELLTLTGHQVLDAGGSPILLDPGGGTPSIGRDGSIEQAGRRVGVIGLFTIDPAARLERGTDATVVPDRPAEPAVDVASIGLRQGYIERSNANPVIEMSRLIADQRMLEAVTGALNGTEQSLQSAIRTLGGSG
jgi:flagellar basal-body rod protein FlgF